MTAEEATRGVAVEKLETMKKWGLNTYKVSVMWMAAFHLSSWSVCLLFSSPDVAACLRLCVSVQSK